MLLLIYSVCNYGHHKSGDITDGVNNLYSCGKLNTTFLPIAKQHRTATQKAYHIQATD